MAGKETKVIIEEKENDAGVVQKFETTIVYGKIKKGVYRRMNIQPFGAVMATPDDGITITEKAIEIRCYPPQQVAVDTSDTVNNIAAQTDALFDMQSQIPRCKLCGMEGHYSLRCPKRKEIDVAKPVDEYEHPRELTIKIANLPDFVSEHEVNDLLSTLKNTVNTELSAQARQEGSYYSSIKALKCSVPRDKEGNSRGLAFINIPQSNVTMNPDGTPQPTSADLFAQRLVDLLCHEVLGYTIIEAVLLAPDNGSRKKKAPNRYDDEEKWGGDKFRK